MVHSTFIEGDLVSISPKHNHIFLFEVDALDIPYNSFITCPEKSHDINCST